MPDYRLKNLCVSHNLYKNNPPRAAVQLTFSSPQEKDKTVRYSLFLNLDNPDVAKKFDEAEFRKAVRTAFLEPKSYASDAELDASVARFIVDYKIAHQCPVYVSETSRAQQLEPVALRELSLYFEENIKRWQVHFRVDEGTERIFGNHSTSSSAPLTDKQRDTLRNEMTIAAYRTPLRSIAQLHALLNEVVAENQHILTHRDIRQKEFQHRPFRLPVRHQKIGIFTLHGPHFTRPNGQLACNFRISKNPKQTHSFFTVLRSLGIGANDTSNDEIGRQRVTRLENALYEALEKASEHFGTEHVFRLRGHQNAFHLADPVEILYFDALNKTLPSFFRIAEKKQKGHDTDGGKTMKRLSDYNDRTTEAAKVEKKMLQNVVNAHKDTLDRDTEAKFLAAILSAKGQQAAAETEKREFNR